MIDVVNRLENDYATLCRVRDEQLGRELDRRLETYDELPYAPGAGAIDRATAAQRDVETAAIEAQQARWRERAEVAGRGLMLIRQIEEAGDPTWMMDEAVTPIRRAALAAGLVVNQA